MGSSTDADLAKAQSIPARTTQPFPAVAPIEQFAACKMNSAGNIVVCATTDTDSAIDGFALLPVRSGDTFVSLVRETTSPLAVVLDGSTSVAPGDTLTLSALTAGRFKKSAGTGLLRCLSFSDAVAGNVVRCIDVLAGAGGGAAGSISVTDITPASTGTAFYLSVRNGGIEQWKFHPFTGNGPTIEAMAGTSAYLIGKTTMLVGTSGLAEYVEFGTQYARFGGVTTVRPYADLGASLGTTALRWGTLYAPLVQDSTSVTLKSSAADGAAAVAAVVDTSTAWSNSGAKLLSLRSNGVEKLSITPGAAGAGPIIASGNSTIRVLDSGGNGFTVEGGLPQLWAGGTGQWQWFSTYFIPITDLGGRIGISSNRMSEVWSRSYYGVQQNVTSGGAITINPAAGEVYKLTANANITSITISTGTFDGQVIKLILVQGGSAFTWAALITNATLAGGTFVKTSPTNSVDVIVFVYDSNSTKWREVSRSLNQG